MPFHSGLAKSSNEVGSCPRLTALEFHAVTKTLTVGRVDQPPADELWHPIALDWYRSLAESGQAQFYEPSDWQTARYVAESMSRNLGAPRFSAQLFAAVMGAMTELLTTEGARRRARLEVERESGAVDAKAAAKIARMDAYRRAASD